MHREPNLHCNTLQYQTWQHAKRLHWRANIRRQREMFPPIPHSRGISPPHDSSWGSRVPPSGCPGLLAEWRWAGRGQTLPSAGTDSPAPPTGTRWPPPPICRGQETHPGILAEQIHRDSSLFVARTINYLDIESHSENHLITGHCFIFGIYSLSSAQEPFTLYDFLSFYSNVWSTWCRNRCNNKSAYLASEPIFISESLAFNSQVA